MSEPASFAAVNFTQALASVKNTIVLLFNRQMETVNSLLHDLLDLISITVEPIRPGRKYPRNHKKSVGFEKNVHGDLGELVSLPVAVSTSVVKSGNFNCR